MIISTPQCPLCWETSSYFQSVHNRTYFQCSRCYAVFLDPASRANKEDEKARYLHHQNDVYDLGYQQFTSLISDAVLRDYSPKDKGLDFGAGTGPVIAKLLTDQHFNIRLYDPFFHNHPPLLEEKYDYIVCCEVMEHFYHPAKELALLKRLLKHNARLYCMTEIYNEEIDFKSWHYKSDPTHVFFYHQQSLNYIKEQFGFSKMTVEGRLIIFTA